MSSQPNTKITLPFELLASIFELASPRSLVASMRCSKYCYEMCSPLLYRQVRLHTPTQLVKLSESQKAMRMLETTTSLAIDEFSLYLEAWETVHFDGPSNPIHYLLRVLCAAISLRLLKIEQSDMPGAFFRRMDWDEELSNATEALRVASSDPAFLPNLTLLSVFHPSRSAKSWFESLCYDRVIESYSIWDSTNLAVKIFPGLERSDTTLAGPHLSSLAISRLASYPKGHLSGRDIGRLIYQSLGSDSRSNLTHFGLQLQLPDVALNGKSSPIHNTFSWLKEILSTVECPQLQALHVRFKSLPLDCEASLDAQRLGLEELQTIAPALVGAGMSSTRVFWKRWVPTPGQSLSHPVIPYWTPCPTVDSGTATDVRAMLIWWLDALGLDASEIRDRTVVKNLAKQLSIAMYERWEIIAPDEATLYGQLLRHFLPTDSPHTSD